MFSRCSSTVEKVYRRIDLALPEHSGPLSVEWAASNVWTRIVSPRVQSGDVPRRSTRHRSRRCVSAEQGDQRTQLSVLACWPHPRAGSFSGPRAAGQVGGSVAFTAQALPKNPPWPVKERLNRLNGRINLKVTSLGKSMLSDERQGSLPATLFDVLARISAILAAVRSTHGRRLTSALCCGRYPFQQTADKPARS
jgi:hypothetical protein